jgi:hypothetical protein
MNNLADIQTPILYWLNKRACYIIKSAGNWDWVMQDPVVGRFTAVLFILGRRGAVSLSEQTRHEIAQIYWSNKARWLVRENYLKQVLNAFRQEGLAAIPLKGAALLGMLYKDIGLRSMSDVDILVQPENFVTAVTILRQLGFQPCPKDEYENFTWLEKLPKAYWPKELSFHDQHGLVIELHQHLINSWFLSAFPLNMDAIWERSISFASADQSVEISGENLWNRRLSPYDTLAYLCLHLALHGLQFPQAYLDIDLWIRNLPEPWDWERFLELVNRWQIRSTAYHELSICRDFMETPLPDNLLERLDPGWLARFRVKMLISSQSILADRPSLGKHYPTLVKLALIDHLPRILVTLLKLAFPDRAWREHNPSGRSLLAHWLHVLQVVKRGD